MIIVYGYHKFSTSSEYFWTTWKFVVAANFIWGIYSWIILILLTYSAVLLKYTAAKK